MRNIIIPYWYCCWIYYLLNLVYTSAPLTHCAIRVQLILGTEQERREIIFHERGVNIPWTMFLCAPAAYQFHILFFIYYR